MSGRNDDLSTLMGGFGALANAFGSNRGGDVGSSFPQSDADDFSHGVRFVPGEVTLARRAGKKVTFVQRCQNSCCWYWQMPDGTKIYHWDRYYFEQIAQANGHKWEGNEFNGNAGACPQCGNVNTSGGTIKP